MKKMEFVKLRHNLFFLFLTGVFIFLGARCGEKSEQAKSAGVSLDDPQKKNYVIVKIEDSSYLNSDFEKYVRGTFGNDRKALTPVSLSRLLDKFIEEKLILQAANNQNISLSWEEKQEYLAKLSTELKAEGSNSSIEEMDTDILFDRLLIEKYTYTLVKDIEVKEEEIKEYYDLHKREFMRPQRIEASQILLETEDKAIEVLERVKNASEEEFRKIAEAESIGLEAVKGGRMGVFERGQLPYEMEQVLFSLKEGEVSPVVESSYGYHIFRVDRTFEPELISEKEAWPEIKAKILDLKVNFRISSHVEYLKNKIEWSFYPMNLSFPYQRDKT
jgi:parvulin-like peptidyl-prolyl isomerase